VRQLCRDIHNLNYLSKKFKGNKIKVLRAYNAGTKGMYKVNNLWYAKKVIKKQKEIKKLAEK
jgi:soluble lytic murein transglycosylase-like protein